MYLLRMVYAMNEVIRPQTFTITECHKIFYRQYIYSAFHDMPENVDSIVQCFLNNFISKANSKWSLQDGR